MKWKKMGHVYTPDGSMPWAVSYGTAPTPFFLNDKTLRVYTAFCDKDTVGRLGYVDLDPENPSRILGVSPKPLLDIGTPGAFDENGVVPTSIVRVGDELYLYYVGFSLGHKVRYCLYQGLAISKDGGESFTRYSRVPVLDRSDSELLNRTAAFAMKENGHFRIWYTAGSEWTNVNGKPLPVYSIKYLESPDGKHWGGHGEACVDFKNADEHAVAKPWVLKDSDRYRMFYSIRSHSHGFATGYGYRLGYAESKDGRKWTRLDEQVGLDVSPSGWDSEMVAYPAVVPYKDRVYMFYCGNGCAKTGFGYAQLESW
jgi:predicted GH43/DUF377 family glycosyl hydrolase